MATLELVRKRRNLIKLTEEYYNALSTNVQLSGASIKLVEVTSVTANEGKSTTATNLAAAFARTGHRTLLVDADIRNSVMSGVFKSQSKVSGLTDFLTGQAELQTILNDTDIDNLDVILAGPVSPNPTGLLQSRQFETLLANLRPRYDSIIVDTSPIGLVIDAAIIAQKCDASLLVTEAGSVKRKAVMKAKEQLEQTGTPFLGVVLNKYNIDLERYGSYGAYGSYGNYGKSN
ncbi:tyrosine-protein kinase [Streptococcus panodentis]|uniref:Tyrosine-protein kinase CpsD n=1 Tax=Streptococcus panodentis TaxID=1581472 RepID=A0ABS5AVZ8_9STRE|nr:MULTISPECIES: tyrosine-protein kinase [Streptococcus]KXT85159.1 Tyrosine-protein kinase EpsD [Streptococcus sp. DD11]MBP2620740.1 tyrosine protein kinase [Streptococcus panodentis]